MLRFLQQFGRLPDVFREEEGVIATPYHPVHVQGNFGQRRSRLIDAERKPLAMIQTSAATHIAISIDRKSEAAWTESEIPVPSAMYAAKQAGHFGSNARTSVGNENFASANPRCLADDGWALPSAVIASLCAAFAAVWQQVRGFIGDSHSRSRTQLLSAPRQSPGDSGHDGGPTTS